MATIEQELELRQVYKNYLMKRKDAFNTGDITGLELFTDGYELKRIAKIISGDNSVKDESDSWDIQIGRFQVRKYSDSDAEVYVLDVQDFEDKLWAPNILVFQRKGKSWKLVSRYPVHFD